ncbi:alpha-galactosidase [Oceanirhabdus seepicola]|uniref:Alpha-galactosidase n=1 Tax=Oceanirhabdus seepicola TaxID=2828781 RepID=A0A9J6NYS9_9CLOT|nr:alpha-galactosidase [Oceanirhabdus seepicola]MCM1988304.1 alpha-galactosidase [Oceanirhabdus seepicola]
MAILYNEKTKEFHIYNKWISYIMGILKNNSLGHLYFGKRLIHRESFQSLNKLERRDYTANVYENDNKFSLEHIKQEYPSYGSGDYRYPAYEIKHENGSIISEFQYYSHKIYKGKKRLKGLPSIYVESEQECETIEINLMDELTNAKIILSYTVFEAYPVITRSVRFENHGTEKLILTSAMSSSIDMDDDNFNMIHLSGAWAREKHIVERNLEQGIQGVYSRRGASSACHNPFIALKRPHTTETNGEVYGFALLYSGNFLSQVEVDFNNISRVTMGINPHGFEWVLDKNDEFQTPESVLVYSNHGMNGMSQVFHDIFRNRLVKGNWRDRERPILINTWEAAYFDFNEEKILKLAEKAKEIGAELLVLDDGWFGERNDDTTSLGDWNVNLRKLPSGIKGLSEKVEKIGLKFGLWIEPEMISKKSNLYKKHPEWLVGVPGRKNSPSRNQHVLDFTRNEVIEYIFNEFSKIFRRSKISYVKWDMNRNITEPFSTELQPERQSEFMHRYILGVYKLYEKFVSEFPDILFESCAGGGGRYDGGMLYYAPQTWTSDCTDGLDRLKIQYGTSLIFPLSTMGAHVSDTPNHYTNRITPMNLRGDVSFFGILGYELDVNKLSNEEILAIKEQIQFYKKWRRQILRGDFYRIRSPFEGDGNITVWSVVSKDKNEALVGYYRALKRLNQQSKRTRLLGLREEVEYKVSGFERTFFGDELMNAGIIIEDVNNKDEYRGDFYSKVIEIKALGI